MSNILKLAIFITMLVPLSTSASTGDLQGVCKGVVLKLFPNSELIGMLGGNMERFNVSGFVIDLSDNTAYEFNCFFPYSHHHKPEQFLLKVFGNSAKDPVRLAREVFAQQKKQFDSTITTRMDMEKAAKEAVKAAKSNEKSVN